MKKIGQRVYIIGNPIGVTLATRRGVIARFDPDDAAIGYRIVRLDVPATYHGNLGYNEPLPEICEADDNLAGSLPVYLIVKAWRRFGWWAWHLCDIVRMRWIASKQP